MSVVIESRTLRFWRWIHTFTEKKIREAYMDQFNHDRKCPKCNRWGALGGFDWKHKREIDPWHDGLTCTNCGHESIWYMGSMLPLLIKHRPPPVSYPPSSI